MVLYKCMRKCCGTWSQRWVVSTAVLSGLAIQYIHRLAFNLAITEITFTVKESREGQFEDACVYNETTKSESEHSDRHREFHWDTYDQALLIGSFYIGYIFSHLPGGILADRYGPKQVLGWSVVVSALCSLLTPLAARTHLYMLVAVRSLMGLAQGPLFPAQSVFVAHWALPTERNLINSYMNVGVIIGAVLSNTCTGLLLHYVNKWDIVFQLYAGITVLWLLLWIVFAFDSATQHPFINESEKSQLVEALSDEVHEDYFHIDYGLLLRSAPVWAMIVGSLGHDWAFYIVLSLLPQYMSYVLLFDVSANGIINSLPYIAMLLLQLISAKIAEILISRKVMSKTNQCKLFFFITNQGPVLCFLLASYAGCSRVLVVALFTTAMGLMGFCYPSIRVVNVDMAPNFAGLLMAIMNGFGALCGFLGPQAFSIFTEVHTVDNWRNAFILSAILVSVTTVVFCKWGSSKVQPWNFPPDNTVNDVQEESQPQTTTT